MDGGGSLVCQQDLPVPKDLRTRQILPQLACNSEIRSANMRSFQLSAGFPIYCIRKRRREDKKKKKCDGRKSHKVDNTRSLSELSGAILITFHCY